MAALLWRPNLLHFPTCSLYISISVMNVCQAAVFTNIVQAPTWSTQAFDLVVRLCHKFRFAENFYGKYLQGMRPVIRF
jgi:hypothetical protein